MLSLYTADIKEYLKCDDVVDFDKPEVKALADKLFAEAEGGTDFVRRAYEYVRDTFPHSADINADEVAVSASDVLKTGHGICHALSPFLYHGGYGRDQYPRRRISDAQGPGACSAERCQNG